MYDMSIVTHNYGVMSVLAVILTNLFMLLRAKELSRYIRAASIFMPIGGTAIGVVVFTGVVMMAAKHLDFTMANIAMIIFAVILIYLEVKRASRLKYINKKEEGAFTKYKSFAVKVLALETVVTLSISFWMWM